MRQTDIYSYDGKAALHKRMLRRTALFGTIVALALMIEFILKPSMRYQWVLVPLLLVFFAPIPYLCVQLFRRPVLLCRVTGTGVEFFSRQGSTLHFYRWEEVEAVRQHSTPSGAKVCCLLMKERNPEGKEQVCEVAPQLSLHTADDLEQLLNAALDAHHQN